jgi:hypothetical protein
MSNNWLIMRDLTEVIGRLHIFSIPVTILSYGAVYLIHVALILFHPIHYIQNKKSSKRNIFHVRFQVLTVEVMKSSILWDIMPCSPLKVNRRFGGTGHLHLQGRRVSRARNQCERRWHCICECLFLRNIRLTSNGLYGVVSEKIELFKYISLYNN